jgi:glucokinase
MQTALAVDLGGTKTAMALVGRDGALREYRKIPAARSMDEAVDSIAEAVSSASSVGIVVPGIFNSATGGVWCPNLFGRDEVPMLEAVQRRVEVPVVIDSDRSGYVLGESWLGAAQGLRDVVFVAVGTGIGIGTLAGGQVVRGARGIAGAAGWWSLTPEWSALYEQCGCWEAEAAGPAIARMADAPDAETAISRARSGDIRAREAVSRAAGYTGRAVANLVSVFDPEMVVLGGGVMQAASDLFLDAICEAVLRWGQPVAARACRIEVTSLGERAGLLGAARLAFERI